MKSAKLEKMLVIGNGESRKSVNLKKIKLPKIGCNAIHRQLNVAHLVCVDRRMVNEVIRAGYNAKNKIYTRREWWGSYRLNQNVHQVPELPYKGDQRPDEPFQWGSGPYAVLLGATLSDHVKLLGFDLYSKTKYVNNIYKGTENYDAADKRAVDPRYWIYQISKVFEHFPNTQFTIHIEDDWQQPESWKKDNVLLDSISNV